MTREEAIQVLQTALTAPFIYGNYANALNMAIEALSAEAVQGEWIDAKMDYGECSECGFFGITTDYCPNCGAKMKGGDTE